jgi:hypothetical protein
MSFGRLIKSNLMLLFFCAQLFLYTFCALTSEGRRRRKRGGGRNCRKWCPRNWHSRPPVRSLGDKPKDNRIIRHKHATLVTMISNYQWGTRTWGFFGAWMHICCGQKNHGILSHSLSLKNYLSQCKILQSTNPKTMDFILSRILSVQIL